MFSNSGSKLKQSNNILFADIKKSLVATLKKNEESNTEMLQ